MTILIVSVAGDFHAQTIQREVRRAGSECHIIEADQIAGGDNIRWRLAPTGPVCLLRTSEDRLVDVGAAAVLWWRRTSSRQQLSDVASDDHQRNLVNADSRGALLGSVATTFRGTWISDPYATSRASDKLIQLTAASSVGFRVPRSLVSQSKQAVLEFRDAERGEIIVKPVVGAPGPLLFTQVGHRLDAVEEDAFRTSPAMYQEYVQGTRHVRLNCFGDRCHAALISSERVDWRPDLNVPMHPWPVPAELARRVVALLSMLNLRMGVLDLKLTADDEPVFLEVNPQGQFLFLEPLTGIPLTRLFTEFLTELSDGGRERGFAYPGHADASAGIEPLPGRFTRRGVHLGLAPGVE